MRQVEPALAEVDPLDVQLADVAEAGDDSREPVAEDVELRQVGQVSEGYLRTASQQVERDVEVSDVREAGESLDIDGFELVVREVQQIEVRQFFFEGEVLQVIF